MDELATRCARAWKDLDPYGFADTYDEFDDAVRDAEGLLSCDPLAMVAALLDLLEKE